MYGIFGIFPTGARDHWSLLEWCAHACDLPNAISYVWVWLVVWVLYKLFIQTKLFYFYKCSYYEWQVYRQIILIKDTLLYALVSGVFATPGSSRVAGIPRTTKRENEKPSTALAFAYAKLQRETGISRFLCISRRWHSRPTGTTPHQAQVVIDNSFFSLLILKHCRSYNTRIY